MKKILLLALFLPFLSIAQENKTGKVSQSITAAKAISGEFQSFEIFNSQTETLQKITQMLLPMVWLLTLIKLRSTK